MTSCPPSERLATLLDDQTPVANLSDLEVHLSDCQHCQQTLLNLTIDTEGYARQRRLLHPEVEVATVPDEFLSGMQRSCLAVVQRQSASEPVPTLPGYEIISELGRGGMAVVYRARHIGLNRPIALKMILAGRHAAPELRSRLRREAEAVARLRHPGVVQIHDIGEHEGLPYFAMELVEGGTLRDRFRAGPLTPTTAAELVESLAQAVHAAHRESVVHRDLKPANILLPNGETSSPKIADFGLATQSGVADGWTRTGDVMGTPAYMAPEQAQGRRADVGPATDVHALGVILYEALTGHTPFAGGDDVATLVRVSLDEPNSLRRLRSSVPLDLETICLKCLRKSPGQRYSSALELAADLRRFLSGEPIHARPVGSRERLAKWVRRNPLVASLLALVVVVTIAGFAGVTAAMFDARSARDEETKQRGIAEDALNRSERSVYLGKIAQARSQWLLNNVATAELLLDQCPPERRNWEWNYLRNLNHGDLLTIPGGGPWVTGVAYSPNGRWLASCGGDPYAAPEAGNVRVHDAATGQLRWAVAVSHLSRCLAFSPDGRTIAIGGENWRGGGGFVQLLDATSGEVVRKFPIEGGAHGLAFAPDGQLLSVSHEKQPVRVYHTATGLEAYRASAARRGCAAFTPDGRFLVYDGPNGLEFRDASGGQLAQAFPQVVGVVAVSPDGTRLAAIDNEQVTLWDMNRSGPDGKIAMSLARAFTDHDGAVAALAFRTDGQAIATAGLDGTVRVREMGVQGDPAVYRGHTGRVVAVAFHPNGRSVASAGVQQGEVKVWDATRMADYIEVASFAASRRDIVGVGFTRGEALVLSLGGVLRRWDCRTGVTMGAELPCSNDWVVPAAQFAFSADGTRLVAVGGGQLVVRVLETATEREVVALRGHTVKVRFVACDSECRRVAAGGAGVRDGRIVCELKVWDVATGRALREETHTDEVWDALALSPDGEELLEARHGVTLGVEGRPVSQRASETLTVTPLNGGAPRLLKVPSAGVTAVAFSPQKRYLAIADEGGVRVLNRDGTPLHESPLRVSGQLGDLAFNPDETRLAGVNRDRVQLWDVASGQDILSLRGSVPRHGDSGFNPRVAWSNDGAKLLASNWHRSATMWDAADASAPAGKAVLASQAAGRAFGWHLDRAERFSESAFASAFHRDWLLSVANLSPLERRQRADLLARSLLWRGAEADYASLFAGGRLDTPYVAEGYAALLLKRGDTTAYLSLRRDILKRCAGEKDPTDPLSVLRLCGLLAATPDECSQMLAIARRYQSDNPHSPLPWECLGLALYRAGEWDAARGALRQSMELWRDRPVALPQVTLALVALRQGKKDEAGPLLKQVGEWLTDQQKWFLPAPTPPSEWQWQLTLEVELLRAEAESLRMTP